MFYGSSSETTGGATLTLPQMLQYTANQFPDRGIGYIQDDGSEIFQSYSQLVAQAVRVLAGLHQLGLKAGDKLILALSRNEEFIPAFWGCVLGGVLPVPMPAPVSLYNPNPPLEKLHNVWHLLECPLVLLDARLRSQPSEEQRATYIQDALLLSFDDIRQDQPARDFHTAPATAPAFIQFSSGSTGEPKGVVITYQNLLCNLRAIATGINRQPDDISLGWLPLHHDMGLIGFHLAPIYSGNNQMHLNTVSFVRRPLLWLDSLEKYHATVTVAPNFSQALVLERLERQPQKKWDLSAVRVLFNGAEPIAVGLMQRFIAKMATYGLDPTAMFPVYGLAEACLAVAFSPLGVPPRIESLNRQALQVNHRAVPDEVGDATAIQFASVGLPVLGCSLRIVDDEDMVVPDLVVGNIQIKGENVTCGYYNNPVAALSAFCGDWLRTGDLGFMRDHHLCVTGRAKDILFVNGQNYYAHDLESIAQQVEGVQSGKVAICGWYDSAAGRDKVLVFLLCNNPVESVQQFWKVKQHLQRFLGLAVDVMIPLKSKQFPKTSSGKLQRYKLRQQFEQGVFDSVIAQISQLLAEEEARSCQQKALPQTFTEKLLLRLWCEELLLAPEEVGIHDSFTELGGDSLKALTILGKLEKQYYIYIDSAILAEHQTIAELAAYIDKHSMLVRRTSTQERKKTFSG